MARHSLHKDCGCFPRRDDIGAQTPKAAGSSAPHIRPAELRPLSSGAPEMEGTSVSIVGAGSPWNQSSFSTEGLRDERIHQDRGVYSARDVTLLRPTSTTHINDQSFPDQLAELIMEMFPGSEGEELGEAFRSAAELPPVTKQSLSELDIPNIITNIKLRHDINFDRDLSFRPNIDGPKGQEKMRQASRYWRSLVAELELYVRLFQGTPRPENWRTIVQHAEHRIPKIFETIHEVLKSLVPDRDHSRVDEHLDVPMLMQEIERGVCDLVRLAEWIAHLLKEHCAPMRDYMVDKMVSAVRVGATKNSSDLIVAGLHELLGILECMKLDVANHQIRNLKTLLIDDTVNFERHYHLDRLVNGRARVNVDAAHKWYSRATEEFRSQITPAPSNSMRLQLEVFVRAVTSYLFSRDGHSELPDAFYLDQDRLRTLKSEIDDLIHFEICDEMFGELLKEIRYEGPVSTATRHHLRTSITAIIGEGVGHGSPQWMINSDSISLELFRQALLLARRPLSYNYDDLQRANTHLRTLFSTSFARHASALESTLLPQILACTTHNITSSPLQLFNTLVTPSPPPPPHYPPPPSFIPIAPPKHHQQTLDTLSLPPSLSEKLSDISNRVTHIVLLHWRIWGPIAYILEDEASSPPAPVLAQPQPQSRIQHSAISALSDEEERNRLPPAPTPPQPHSARPPPPPAVDVDPEAQAVEPPPDPGTKISRGPSVR